MAKFRPSIAGDISGKFGGAVFSRNRYGAYLRARVIPVNPRTSYQTAQRAKMSANSSGWRALTVAQRMAWDTVAPSFPWRNKAGHVIVLSGQALYCAINNLRMSLGLPVQTAAPSALSVTDFSATAAVITAPPGVTLTYTSVLGATEYIILEATCARSPGTMFGGGYKQIAVLGTADVSPYAALAKYLARYGVIGAVGQRVFFRARKAAVDAVGGIGVSAYVTFEDVIA